MLPHPVPWVASRLDAAVRLATVGSACGLAATGVALALGWSRAGVLLLHRLLAEAALVLAVALLVVMFATAAYRASRLGWVLRAFLLVIVMVAATTGHAAGAGEAGEEGRAHLAPWLDRLAFAAVHAAVGVAVLAGVAALRASPPGWVGPRRAGAAALAAFLLAVAASAPGVLVERALPEVGGVQAEHAPWFLRAFALVEEPGLAPLAGGLLVLVAAALLAPLADRGAGPWRRVSVVLAVAASTTLAALLLVASRLPAAHGA